MALKVHHPSFVFLAGLLFTGPNVKAQQAPATPPAKTTPGLTEIYNSRRPYINYSETDASYYNMNPYNSGAPYNPYAAPAAPAPVYNPTAPYIPGSEVTHEEPKSISRLSGGVGLSMTNVGVINSLYRQTNDTVYKKSNATEFGFGVAGFLDFSVPQGPGALRIKGGASKLQIKPNSQTKAAYSGAQLENSETLFNLSLLYRISLPADTLGFGTFWAGAGFHMVYAMSTQRFDKVGNASGGSKIANSYGYSPLIALGSELPFTSTEDFTLSADWIPWRGFIVMGGIKTAL